jgi:hypothetical protein
LGKTKLSKLNGFLAALEAKANTAAAACAAIFANTSKCYSGIRPDVFWTELTAPSEAGKGCDGPSYITRVRRAQLKLKPTDVTAAAAAALCQNLRLKSGSTTICLLDILSANTKMTMVKELRYRARGNVYSYTG